MIILSHGYHCEKESGEIFIGNFSEYHIKKFVPWETKRMGDLVEKGPERGKHPLFISCFEVIRKGWNIH